MEYSMGDIVDPNDFTLFSDSTRDSAESKRTPLKRSSTQNKRKDLNKWSIQKRCYIQNSDVNVGSPHLPQNRTLQMNPTIGKEQDMVEQNPLGINQVVLINNVNNFIIPESKAEVVNGKSFTLYPPKNFNSISLFSKKLPNCNTVSVRGLPKNIKESVIFEIFGRFGNIDIVFFDDWLKKTSSCLICYKNEESADKALAFSGYRLVIDGDSENDNNSGLIFVDYSQPRKDIVAWEQKQNSEKSTTLKLLNTESPCTYAELIHALNKIKSNNDFMETLQEIATWLQRGDCNKYNALNFYNIINAIISFAKRIQEKRGLHPKKSLKKISAQFNQIQTIFEAVYQPEVWSIFTVPQRNSFEIGKAEFQVIKSAIDDDLKKIGYDDDDDDDYDDDDEPSEKKIKLDVDMLEKDDKVLHLIKAYKSKIMALKKRHKQASEELNRRLDVSSKSLLTTNAELLKLKIELDKTNKTKNNEIEFLQKVNEKSQEIIKEQENNIKKFHELKNLYENLQNKCNILELNISNLQKEKSYLETKQRDYQQHSIDFLATQIELLKNIQCEEINHLKHDLIVTRDRLTKFRTPISLESAKLIALIYSFLLSFSTGIHLDDILAYIRRFQINTTKEDLESLMSRCHNMFRKNIHGNWILTIYNTREIQEDKDKHSTGDPLKRVAQIVDLLGPAPTSMLKRRKKNTINNHTINTSSDVPNRNSPGTNLDNETTQFLNELNTSSTSKSLNLIENVPLDMPIFNKKKETPCRLQLNSDAAEKAGREEVPPNLGFSTDAPITTTELVPEVPSVELFPEAPCSTEDYEINLIKQELAVSSRPFSYELLARAQRPLNSVAVEEVKREEVSPILDFSTDAPITTTELVPEVPSVELFPEATCSTEDYEINLIKQELAVSPRPGTNLDNETTQFLNDPPLSPPPPSYVPGPLPVAEGIFPLNSHPIPDFQPPPSSSIKAHLAAFLDTHDPGTKLPPHLQLLAQQLRPEGVPADRRYHLRFEYQGRIYSKHLPRLK